MLRVGLTGGIGAGKSTVAGMLAERGAVVIDADAIAREVVAPGTDGLCEIVDTFGAEMLRPDGSLDRERLGRRVFADDDARRRLEEITHPRIGAETQRRLTEAERDGVKVVVHDIPLLVEKGMAEAFDAVIVVEAPDELRVERLEQRGLARDDARQRMAKQATSEERKRAATHVIVNDGSVDELRQRVDEVCAALGL